MIPESRGSREVQYKSFEVWFIVGDGVEAIVDVEDIRITSMLF
jgi:hypothetical protein